MPSQRTSALNLLRNRGAGENRFEALAIQIKTVTSSRMCARQATYPTQCVHVGRDFFGIQKRAQLRIEVEQK